MISAWSKRRKIEITDAQYSDQYHRLFNIIDDDEIDDRLVDLMDKASFPYSIEYVKKVEEFYKEIWETDGLPCIDIIEERMIEAQYEVMLKFCEKEHKNDREFWENEEYRLNVFEDYEESFWCNEGCILTNIIEEALDYLNLTYIDYDDDIINSAQRVLFELKER